MGTLDSLARDPVGSDSVPRHYWPSRQNKMVSADIQSTLGGSDHGRGTSGLYLGLLPRCVYRRIPTFLSVFSGFHRSDLLCSAKFSSLLTWIFSMRRSTMYAMVSTRNREPYGVHISNFSDGCSQVELLRGRSGRARDRGAAADPWGKLRR